MGELNRGKYAQVERERRFLLAAAPTDGVTQARQIADRYLRRSCQPSSRVTCKG